MQSVRFVQIEREMEAISDKRGDSIAFPFSPTFLVVRRRQASHRSSDQRLPSIATFSHPLLLEARRGLTQ